MPGSGDGQSAILVVDDNEVNRLVAVEELKHLGYRTDEAEDGRAAVKKVAETAYFLVLMDCQMPQMDGYAATREIRRIEATLGRRTPVIALTAHAMAGERQRVMEAGMDDYMTKPFRTDALKSLIRTHVFEPNSVCKLTLVENKPIALQLKVSPRVAEMALKQIPGQLEELERATGDGSGEGKALAHRLKGTCLALGATQMAAWCSDLEKAFETSDFPAAADLMLQIVDGHKELKVALEKIACKVSA